MSISVKNLTHIYNKGLAYEVKAVDDVSFDIADAQLAGIIGHTGSGKSTLIQHLNGILKPDSGNIFINGTDITAKSTKLYEIRKRVALVFQYPEYQLFEETVALDVAFGPKNLGLEVEEIHERVKEALLLVGLNYSEFENRSPFELSGGQKRRVAIAGVVAMRPEILILDEPTAGLDPKAHDDILKMISEIRDKTQATIILVSHNMGDIASMADVVFVMDRGKLVKSGDPHEVFADSRFLSEIGLGLPPPAKFLELLATKGVDVPVSGSILTQERLTEYLAGRLQV